jgi:HSP20 family protein
MLERSERGNLNPEQKQQGRGELQNRGSSGRSLSPIAQMDRLFDEMFKRPFFSLLSPRLSGGEEIERLYVPIDIYEDGESVVCKAEIPGMKKEDISVQLTPDSIIISGEKRSERKVEESNFYRLESSSGSFTRTCQLPTEIIPDKARAVFKDGVLEVRVPKSEEAARRVKKINIE